MNKNHSATLLDNILLFFLIFISGGVHIFSLPESTFIMYSLLIVAYLKKNCFKWHKQMLAPILILIMLFGYAIIIAPTSHDFKYLGHKYAMIIVALLYINYLFINRIDFIHQLYVILRFFMIHAFIGYILSYTVTGLFTYTTSEYSDYQSLGNLFYYKTEGPLGYRMYGLFWEPGVLQYYMNLLVFIATYFIKNKNVLIASILAILLTQSSTGLSILAIQGVFYFFNSLKKFSIHHALLIIILLASSYNMIKDNIESKITGNQKISFVARQYDTVTGVMIALAYPMGIGFSNEKYNKVANSGIRFKEGAMTLGNKDITDRGNTNSIVSLLFSVGFFWCLLFIYYLYNQTIFPDKKFLFFLINIITFFTEPILLLPLPFMIILYGMINNPMNKVKYVIK